MLLIRRRVQIILLKVNNSDKYFYDVHMAVGIVRMKLLCDVFVFMSSTLSPVKA